MLLVMTQKKLSLLTIDRNKVIITSSHQSVLLILLKEHSIQTDNSVTPDKEQFTTAVG